MKTSSKYIVQADTIYFGTFGSLKEAYNWAKEQDFGTGKVSFHNLHNKLTTVKKEIH